MALISGTARTLSHQRVSARRKRLSKNLNSDGHFDRSFSFMAMKANYETTKKGTINESINSV
jgi:hypothetical protein